MYIEEKRTKKIFRAYALKKQGQKKKRQKLRPYFSDSPMF